MVSVFAPAKLNLTLLVGKPYENGQYKNYHPLNSLVAFTQGIGDKIDIRANEGFEFKIVGRFAQNLSLYDNLVFEAAHIMARKFGRNLDIAIELEKNLPIAAGIGGGSADAAALILGLNKFWRLGLSKSEMCEIGLELGADIPVCILGDTIIMESIGNEFSPAPKLPNNIAILLANPLIECQTAAVFKVFDEIGDFADLEQVSYKDCENFNELVAMLSKMPNTLTKAAGKIVPQINVLIETIKLKDGAKFTAMSGSGATVFALFDDYESANYAAKDLETKFGANNIWVATGLIRNAK